jgi:hypothetical protein
MIMQQSHLTMLLAELMITGDMIMKSMMIYKKLFIIYLSFLKKYMFPIQGLSLDESFISSL